MLTSILKKFGRPFIILTREDLAINAYTLNSALLVNLPSEEHLYRAICSIRARYTKVSLKIIAPHFKKAIIPTEARDQDICGMGPETRPPEYIRKLKEFKVAPLDAVIILSLDPFLVFNALMLFKCPVLLYNYCGEWYLIRRKTIREFLAGEKGVDRLLPLKGCLSDGNIFILAARNIAGSLWRASFCVFRFFYASLYIILNTVFLLSSRLYYRLFRS